MKICVVGTGYVGLVTGACFADMGHEVICVDIDEAKIERLKKGEIPIYEPGLEDIVNRNTQEARLVFTTDIDQAVKKSKACFIAVGTPPGEDGSADLRHVLAVAKSIGIAMNGYKVIIDKSTVPVGTADKVREAIAAETSHAFDVVSNPEFLKEGTAVEDCLRPSRIVVGTDNAQAEKVMKELYEPFIRTGNPLLLMDTRSAEVTKYAANAMLATRISFMNEMANFCERVGANIDEVRKGLGTDPRIGGKFLFAGVGYGGSCFPKDVQAIIKTGHQHHLEMTLIEAVEKVNHHQKTVLVEKIEKHFHHKLEGKTFAVWGLSFKPNTDDMREAPSLIVIQHLLKAGAIVRAYDPVAIDETRKILPKEILYCKNAYDALEGADALVLVTEWNEFRTPDFKKMLKLMKTGVIFDGRNVYDPLSIQEHGFDAYYSIGR